MMALFYRLTCRRADRKSLHVRRDKKEGTMATLLGAALLNDLDRSHLVGDTIGRAPKVGTDG